KNWAMMAQDKQCDWTNAGRLESMKSRYRQPLMQSCIGRPIPAQRAVQIQQVRPNQDTVVLI
ncbi:MAG: hypothetical protein ACKPKO_09835, partial [Candidatus Fonsibacter sp.]